MKAVLLRGLLLTPVVALVDWQVMMFSPWPIVWSGFTVVGLGLLLAGRWGRRSSSTTWGVALLVAGVLGGVLARYLNVQQIAANKLLVEQVAAALQAHRAARGNYPETLAELVPTYLPQLPVPAIGVLASAPWLYTPSELGGVCAVGWAIGGFALLYSKGEWSALPLPW